MQCPRCGLERPAETLDCECGWEAVVISDADRAEFDADDPVCAYVWGLAPRSPWRRRLARLALFGPVAACLALVIFQSLTHTLLYVNSNGFTPEDNLPLAYGSHLVILAALFYLLPSRAFSAVPWPLRLENHPWRRQAGLSGQRTLWLANRPGLSGLLLLALTHGLVLLAQWLMTVTVNRSFTPGGDIELPLSYLARSAWLAGLLVLVAFYESVSRVLHPRPRWRLTFTLIFLLTSYGSYLLSFAFWDLFELEPNCILVFCVVAYLALFMTLFVRRAWHRAARRLESETMTPSAFNAQPTPPLTTWPVWLTHANPVFRLTAGLEPRSRRRATKALIALLMPSVIMVTLTCFLGYVYREANNRNLNETYHTLQSIGYAIALVALPFFFRRILTSTPVLLRPEGRDELRMAGIGGYARLWGSFAPGLAGAGLLLLVLAVLLTRMYISQFITCYLNGVSVDEFFSNLGDDFALSVTFLALVILVLFAASFDAALRAQNYSYIVRIILVLVYCAGLFGVGLFAGICLDDSDIRNNILGLGDLDGVESLIIVIFTTVWLAVWVVIAAWRRAAQKLEAE